MMVRREVGLRVLACALPVLALGACKSGGRGSERGSDPGSIDFPVFYVKRTIPPVSDDLRQLRDAVPDADLYMRNRASPSALERNLTASVTGTGAWDVKDVEISTDGEKVVFAMRGPLTVGMDEEEGPTWNIWEYDVPTDTLRRVIPSDLIAEEGHDVSPHYLPDGRIVFTSTRQRQSKGMLLDENNTNGLNRPQFEAQTEDRSESAFVLHVMNADGSNIRQISFNQSHDMDPTVLTNGRVLFSRWDRAPGKDGIHLYTMNPDGTDLQLHYGANSHESGTNDSTVQFVRAREMENGRILALIRPYTDVDFGGDLVSIDASTYVENFQPVLAHVGLQGPAQARATAQDVRTPPGPSRGGRFNAAYPLWDGTNRILLSWTQCRLLDTTTTPATIVPCDEDRLLDPDVQMAPPLYSVWMYDPAENTLLPVMEPVEGIMVTDVVAAQPRQTPAVILDKVAGLDLDADWVSEGVGVLDIRSVYDFDGVDSTQQGIRVVADPMQTPAPQRSARFIRLEKAVSIPDDDVLDLDADAFGITPFMREILGYAPIEPDGSVRIKVPANVAFQISILDSNAQRIFPVHRNWLQLRPGEVVQCNGCHQPASEANPRSHGRAGLYAPVNTGAATAGQPFPNTNPAFSPDAGETMAQTRARTSCTLDTPRCRQMTPSLDVIFTDEWTDPASSKALDPNIAYLYGDLRTPAPAPSACSTAWSASCRSIINYETHIHPLWSIDRLQDTNGDGIPDIDIGTLQPINRRCIACHSPTNALGLPRVPAGQLDLSDGPSNEVPQHQRAYRELLFTDNEQDVNMGTLQDRPGPVTVPPSMSAGNARGSNRFFSRFAVGGTHGGYLTAAELRLLSEWLDIGAQYFNNPFDPAAPLN